MFISTILLLLPFLMITFLPMTLKSFSSDELYQMGVQLETSETPGHLDEKSNYSLPVLKVVCAR